MVLVKCVGCGKRFPKNVTWALLGKSSTGNVKGIFLCQFCTKNKSVVKRVMREHSIVFNEQDIDYISHKDGGNFGVC